MNKKQTRETSKVSDEMANEKAEDRIPKPLVDKEWRGAVQIVVPIFKQMVSLFVGSKEQMIKFYNREKGNPKPLAEVIAKARLEPDADSNVKVFGITYINGPFAFIRINEIDVTDMECIGTLYHEALHVALTTMGRTGAEIGENGETLAYLQGYIVSALLQELKGEDYATIMPDGKRIPSRISREEMRKKLARGFL